MSQKLTTQHKTQISLLIVLCIVALIVGLTSVHAIDEGERGVMLTNGRISKIVEPGLTFTIPFFQRLERISTRTRTMRIPNLEMYSYDQQIAELEVTVTYHNTPEQIEAVYRQYGASELYPRAVLPRVKEVSKSVFGLYTAARAIQERAHLNAAVNIAIKEALVDIPVVIENIQIENVDFSDTYELAVEQAARAKADVERAKSELARVEQEAQQKVKNAEAEAAATKARADAEAYSVRQAGEAQADALRARGAALRDNPELINLIKAERWNGVLPVTMIPGSSVPFIDINK
ncbi:MAG: prohibitin family protein [Bradymonadales bacterium]|jgi:regulator of protease activity HflC (stomatin/prohibitin superfamily)